MDEELYLESEIPKNKFTDEQIKRIKEAMLKSLD